RLGGLSSGPSACLGPRRATVRGADLAQPRRARAPAPRAARRAVSDLHDFRAQVRQALEERLTPRRPDGPFTLLGAGSEDLDAGRKYLRALADGGWAVPTWPREYGGLGASPAQAAIVAQELARFETPDLYPYVIGLAIAGPT